MNEWVSNVSEYLCVKCGTFYDEHVAFCTMCSSFRSVVVCGRRPASLLWRTPVESETARSLIGRYHKYLCSRAYPDIKFGERSLVAVYGAPGAGKTTFLLKLLDGLDGSVVFFSIEEGLSESFISKLRWLEITRTDFVCAHARDLLEFDLKMSEVQPVAVGIDSFSVCGMTIDDMRRLSFVHGVPIFFSLHVTKELKPAGLMSTLHLADVVIAVDGMKWSVEKSRYTGLISGGV